jgi:spore germination protein
MTHTLFLRTHLWKMSIILAIIMFAIPFAAAHAQEDTHFEISAWVPYWKAASGTESIMPHVGEFTEVNPFIYTVKQDGTLFQADSVTDIEWKTLQATAKAEDVRYIPTVMWSNSEAMHTVLSDPLKRKAHINSILQQVYANRFDGIDIDYEAKYAKTNPHFSTFLKELNAAMGVNKWVMCTIEARTPLEARYSSVESIPSDIAYANDFSEINKYCDRVRIMAYDQGRIDVQLNKSNDHPYMPVADTEWVEKVVRLAMEEIDADKITIGIATYGYEYDMFPSETNPSTNTYSRLWSFNPGYASRIAEKLDLNVSRTGSGEALLTFLASLSPEPGIPLPNATRVLIWSDEAAIREKFELARKLGIRGVSVFKIDGGEDQGIWDVIAENPKGIDNPGAQKPINMTLATETKNTSSNVTLSMPTSDLESGDRSEDVRTLQKFLNDNGYTVRAEGLGSKGNETDFFGAGTRAALIKFQTAHNISPAVGYYGPITRSVIAEL